MQQHTDTKYVTTLVGNKADLPNREVTNAEATQYAQENGFGYIEVSAKTGANIEEAF